MRLQVTKGCSINERHDPSCNTHRVSDPPCELRIATPLKLVFGVLPVTESDLFNTLFLVGTVGALFLGLGDGQPP